MPDRCRRHGRRSRGRCALVAAVGVTQVVTGCSLHRAPSTELAFPAVVSGASARPAPLRSTLGRYEPTSIAIPRIAVNAPLTRVGSEGNGQIKAPPLDDHNLAGWYERGATPGEPGTAVIVGHLDTTGGPAVFARLRELEQGDVVGVVRADETVAVFKITAVEQVAKHRFPAGRVHGSGQGGVPELRLVTCAGTYDESRRSYPDNLILYATFAAAYRVADLLKT
ncbi:class F sortase [Spirillospora sp. NPDC047279]|uniref:class F sortase n=1 Tax=Spirillospora sp. NPDC047279 TaxID=3155478 RepID=UPI0033DEC4C7